MLPPLCRQLAAMLAAGVPLSRALAVSYESSQDRTVKETLIKLRESVHKGRTLYEAMEEMPGAFPKLLVYMVQTGEASGTLDHMLER
ncbi:type II secretion system F family protein, partial [Eggerthella lenta]|nr:type II secretion system F family protein [Eggerthella lenta]